MAVARLSKQGSKSDENTAQWQHVAHVVGVNEVALKAAAADYRSLVAFAQTHEVFDNGLFGKFRQLISAEYGIDYFAIRDAQREREASDMTASVAHRDARGLVLYAVGDGDSDPDGQVGSYAVCAESGEVIWYGDFFEDDKIFEPGDQLSADQSAFDKAAYVAVQARQQAGIEAVWCEIRYCNPHVDTDGVAAKARYRGVALTARQVREAENPARRWVLENRFQSWKKTYLPSLLRARTDAEYTALTGGADAGAGEDGGGDDDGSDAAAGGAVGR